MFDSVRQWAAAAFALPAFALAQAPPLLPAAPAATPAPAAAAVPCDKCADGEKKEKPPFADVPPIQPLPRLGYFQNLPTGPGYYTALEWLHDEERQKPPK